MDIIGKGIAAEVELLAAIVQFFKAIGITHQDIGIKVNSRKVMASVLKAMGVTDDKFAPVCVVMDKMDKIGPEETQKELVATQGLDAETAEKIVSCLLCKSVDDLARCAATASIPPAWTNSSACSSSRRITALATGSSLTRRWFEVWRTTPASF